MMSQTLKFIFDQPLKQWLTGRKRGKMEIPKFEYLKNKKSFLDEIKNIFHLVRNKSLIKNTGHEL